MRTKKWSCAKVKLRRDWRHSVVTGEKKPSHRGLGHLRNKKENQSDLLCKTSYMYICAVIHK